MVGLMTVAGALPAAGEEAGDARVARLEAQMLALGDELAALKHEGAVDRARMEDAQEEWGALQRLLDRVKLGGYGAIRFDGNDLDAEDNTFTFRRLVLTTEAQIAPKLRFYSEIEYERFRELELEREVSVVDASAGGPGLQVKQELEGTNGSEIALEQAWLEYEIDPRLRLRTGAVLVPLGRFNINHDDNQWNLSRRTLVDRGSPVLPVKAAWDELGVGFTGSFDVGEGGLDYQLYVVNGATLDASVEQKLATRAGKREKLELEGEFGIQNGTFSKDVKGAKALAGRVAWQPLAGQEIALSFYRGRYTPDFLKNRAVDSFAVDGIARILGFEIEGEYVYTRFHGLGDVARDFARNALHSERANASADDPLVESEIAFQMKGIAQRKHGYWIELRRPFWPDVLPSGGFENPLLIPVLRFEQVFMEDLITDLVFGNSGPAGVVETLDRNDATLYRSTLGLAWRPTPLVAFNAAWERTWTHEDSLDGLTNFLRADGSEDVHNSFLLGASFGF